MEDLKNRFIADGQKRAENAHRPGIRVAVRARHAAELAGAGFFERQKIELQIRREIQEALAEVAPPGACY